MKHPRLSTAATLLAALAALIFIIVAAATLTACTPTPRIVEHTLIRRDTVRIATHDTLRRVRTERDSTFRRDSIYTDPATGTLVKDRLLVRTLIRHDTVRIATRDTLRRAAIVDARQVREHSPSLLRRIGRAALRWVLAPLGVLALAAILALLGRALIRRLLARP